MTIELILSFGIGALVVSNILIAKELKELNRNITYYLDSISSHIRSG